MRDNLIKKTYISLIACLAQIFPIIIALYVSFNFQQPLEFVLVFIDCLYFILMVYFESKFINWANSKNKMPSDKEIKRGYMIKKETVAFSIIIAILRVLVILAILFVTYKGELPRNVCLGYNCLGTLTVQFVQVILIAALFIISLYNDADCLKKLSLLRRRRRKMK